MHLPIEVPGEVMEAGSEIVCGEIPSLEDAEQMLEQRNLAAAIASFDSAERLGADCDRCAAGRWFAYMLGGNFTGAWKESDAIRDRAKPDPHRFWNGEDVCGKNVVVRCLHGFGDAIQMLRYAPKLRALGAELVVEVAPRLVELARCLEGVGEVITWSDDAPVRSSAWDVQMEIMELPYFFRTTMKELPVVTNYVTIPKPAEVEVAHIMRCRERPRVGIVWAAGRWNSSRDLPFEFVRQIVSMVDVEFWNLQGDREQARWRSLADMQLRDATECGDGLLTLATVIDQLDLVITVDTLAAHVAGALGKPAWVLLQKAADWRWMVERNDSPWYPSARLYRQPSQDDWNGAVELVKRDLNVWSKQWMRSDLNA